MTARFSLQFEIGASREEKHDAEVALSVTAAIEGADLGSSP